MDAFLVCAYLFIFESYTTFIVFHENARGSVVVEQW